MSIQTFSFVEIKDYKNIRQRIIDEFNTTSRRNIGDNYQIPTDLSKNDFILATDLNKVYHDLHYVNSDTMQTGQVTSKETYIKPYGVETALTIYEGKPYVGYNSGCKEGCIGLCQGCSNSCVGGCTSCSGCTSCTGDCSGTCSGCTGGCTGCKGCSGCGSGCSGTCDGCSGCGGCGGDCFGTATGGCGNCTGSCTGCGSCPEGH